MHGRASAHRDGVGFLYEGCRSSRRLCNTVSDMLLHLMVDAISPHLHMTQKVHVAAAPGVPRWSVLPCIQEGRILTLEYHRCSVLQMSVCHVTGLAKDAPDKRRGASLVRTPPPVLNRQNLRAAEWRKREGLTCCRQGATAGQQSQDSLGWCIKDAKPKIQIDSSLLACGAAASSWGSSGMDLFRRLTCLPLSSGWCRMHAYLAARFTARRCSVCPSSF